MHTYAKVNRQSLQITLAAFCLVAAISFRFLALPEFIERFLIAPLITGLLVGALHDYLNASQPSAKRYTEEEVTTVSGLFALLFPLSLGLAAICIVLATERYQGLSWVGPFFGVALGIQIANLFHDRHVK